MSEEAPIVSGVPPRPLRRWLEALVGLRQPRDPGEERTLGIARGALSSLAAQGISIVTGFLAVPLAIGYLGAERYGAWAIIGSILAWLTVADLGIGNQLTNSLSAARGRRDVGEARALVSTATFALAALGALLLVASALSWWLLDWPRIFNVEGAGAVAEVAPAAGIALAGFGAAFPLAVAERVYTSYQDGAVANAWNVAASLAGLAGLFLATRTGGGLVAVVAATTAAGLAVRGASAAWLFRARRPELRPARADVTRERLLHFGARGSEFFLVQIAALVLYSTDNLIIAQVLGAEAVTPYAVAWRLFAVPGMAFSAAFPYLWAAYAEALARGDRAWVLRALRWSVVGGTLVVAALTLPLVAFGREIIRFWAGRAAVPPWPTLAWLGAWNLVLTPMNAIVCLLNAAGKIRWQVYVGAVTALANVAVSIWWAKAFGVSGVIAATVVTYVLCVMAPATFVGVRTARKLAARP
ncbi:MAG TPA: lipopolysaccharide biosynthesis protein [Anaeromyxobacter sp.]